jgi:hypothetical protein
VVYLPTKLAFADPMSQRLLKSVNNAEENEYMFPCCFFTSSQGLLGRCCNVLQILPVNSGYKIRCISVASSSEIRESAYVIHAYYRKLKITSLAWRMACALVFLLSK